jgi:rare lipoprotein A
MQLRSGLTACTAILAWGASDIAAAQSPHQFTGIAAYYSTDYSGRTARGDKYDAAKLTAAHRSLPFGTRLRVTDPRSKRSVVVVVNDRGPFTKGRVLDLSLAAAKALHMIDRGLLKVTAVVEPATTTVVKPATTTLVEPATTTATP